MTGKTTKSLKKIGNLIEGLSDPSKLLKAVLPLKGSFLIDSYKKFPYKGETWDLVIMVKEIDEGEDVSDVSVNDSLTLGQILNMFPIGKIKVLAEEITWQNHQQLALFLKRI